MPNLIAHSSMPITRGDFDGFVGQCDAMRRVYTLIERAAALACPVFISGPSGTGKELAAQSLHRQGPRHQKRFIAVNCAALPASMIESEIFGHRRGAFTGATADHQGLLARANGGTLFLDEITEMPPGLQAKLLRVVECGTYTPLGDHQERRIDIRFIAASNRDIPTALHEGYLRADLYYRLCGVSIVLPPLAERGQNDIERIADHLLAKLAQEFTPVLIQPRISKCAVNWLCRQPWMGNVRELEHILRQTLIVHRPAVLTADHLPHQHTLENTRSPITLAAAERQHIETAIALCHGNLSAAARRLGVDVSTLHRKQKSWMNA